MVNSVAQLDVRSMEGLERIGGGLTRKPTHPLYLFRRIRYRVSEGLKITADMYTYVAGATGFDAGARRSL